MYWGQRQKLKTPSKELGLGRATIIPFRKGVMTYGGRNDDMLKLEAFTSHLSKWKQH
ncbi:MAG: hypothetical protein CM15mP62_13350 [Rhodospirillaceae bacterium]|nr:MAG: hypothetical protein CM15mP62_13350 [Rhodospirillaceae bacterium]